VNAAILGNFTHIRNSDIVMRWHLCKTSRYIL